MSMHILLYIHMALERGVITEHAESRTLKQTPVSLSHTNMIYV